MYFDGIHAQLEQFIVDGNNEDSIHPANASNDSNCEDMSDSVMLALLWKELTQMSNWYPRVPIPMPTFIYNWTA